MSLADQIFIDTCRNILDNGISDENLEVRPKWLDGTPAHTIKNSVSSTDTTSQKSFLSSLCAAQRSNPQ